MKRLHVRFIGYFSVGLFLFFVYCILLLMILEKLIKNWGGTYVDKITLSVTSASQVGILIAIVLFCFLTGGALFSLFLVHPLSRIIGLIGELSKENYDEVDSFFTKRNRLKWNGFLYREVILQIKHLCCILKENEIERVQIEEAKNDWLAGVSHDLKTPLSYVNGYASLLLNENYQFSHEEIKAYVHEIYAKGIYIEKLINDLNFAFSIDASGNVQLKHAQTDMISFMQRLLSDVANDPGSMDFIFEFESQIEKLEMVIDEALMYRALYNLLMNCVEHNPPGTSIIATLDVVDQGVEIIIADNGRGMTQELLEHVFDKYFSRTKKLNQGKGLGMFVSRQIVEAHDGSIVVTSLEGEGTKIRILLGYRIKL